MAEVLARKQMPALESISFEGKIELTPGTMSNTNWVPATVPSELHSSTRVRIWPCLEACSPDQHVALGA